MKFQRKWGNPLGWNLMLTIGQGWGLGLMWHYARYNGVDFYLGPLCISVRPPAPADLR